MKIILSVYLAFCGFRAWAEALKPVNTSPELPANGLFVLENIRRELGGFRMKKTSKELVRTEQVKPSEGERRVEYLKAQVRNKLVDNREKIQKLGGGEEKIRAALEKNRSAVRKKKSMSAEESFYQEVLEKLQKFQSLEKERLENWNKEIAKKRAVFKKTIPEVKKHLIEIPSDFILPDKFVEEKIIITEQEEVLPYIVARAFELPIRNQKSRPTCSAFAGVRALEILMLQNSQALDLSEQYFYFASKPSCQKSPCSKRGSWGGKGLAYNRKGFSSGIPLEKDCPYQSATIASNQTQIPLANSCGRGRLQVQEFEYLKTNQEALAAIQNGKSVIASFRLSENFYSTQGLVSLKDAKQSRRTHSGGHAVLLVGVIPLPENLRNEGEYCFLAANSWGEGWGIGGYACLTERWMQNYRNGNPHVVVNTVSYQGSN